MLPDSPDQFREKPLVDFGPSPDQAASPHAIDFPGRSAERWTRKVYRFVWNGPTGAVAVTVTDYADYFGTRHAIEIDLPPGTLFPLEDLSFPVSAADIARAGDAQAFVQQLISVVESLDYWKDAATRARQGDLFGAKTTLDDPPIRPSRRRRRLRRQPAPRR
jgi:hypothetical protein